MTEEFRIEIGFFSDGVNVDFEISDIIEFQVQSYIHGGFYSSLIKCNGNQGGCFISFKLGF